MELTIIVGSAGATVAGGAGMAIGAGGGAGMAIGAGGPARFPGTTAGGGADGAAMGAGFSWSHRFTKSLEAELLALGPVVVISDMSVSLLGHHTQRLKQLVIAWGVSLWESGVTRSGLDPEIEFKL
ncbi:MAG: hypothetical protein ACLPTF_19605 [Steroidobacteraceae bacterium]